MSLRVEQEHPSAVARDALDLVHRADDPPRVARRYSLEAAWCAVLVLEPVEHDVELELSDRADDRCRAQRVGAGGVEHLRRPFLGELAQPRVELLPLER